MTTMNAPTFRQFLMTEFLQRQARNRRYSLRAFARSLALSPSRLSDYVNGRGGLSAQRAIEAADRLSLSESETHLLHLVIQRELGKLPLAQAAARRALGE